ncbi:MAG: helix-turn-helix transcriptional regulator [Victivallaceae bacterium]|nr:helix-turn-helix transcriptional regulator [Victivallaceae bacterium]
MKNIDSLRKKFAEKLKKCTRERHVRQKVLAALLGVTESAVSQIYSGRIVPNKPQLDRIAEHLKLSMIERHELNTMLAAVRMGAEHDTPDFAKIFYALRKGRGVTPQQLAYLSGISVSRIRQFEETGEAVPTLDEAEKLGGILNCSPLDLVNAATDSEHFAMGLPGILQAGVLGAENDTEDSAAVAAEPGAFAVLPGAVHSTVRLPLFTLQELIAANGNFSVAVNASSMVTNDLFDAGCRAAIVASAEELDLRFFGNVLLLIGNLCDIAPSDLRLICRSVGTAQRIMLADCHRGRYRVFAGSRRMPVDDKPLWELPVAEVRLVFERNLGRRR